MVQIKNKTALIDKSENVLTSKARKLVLDSLEYAVNAVDPKKMVLSKVAYKGDVLLVGDYLFDLTKYRSVYVVGGGKAAAAMAEAMEQILGDRITAGIVIVPYGAIGSTHIIDLHEARHPLPDESGVEGTRRMLEIAGKAEADDLVICLLSGGGSSLMVYPRENLLLSDKQQITSSLLKSGATINEVNAVRKHLSSFKGGWLAKTAYPATVLNLILSDVVGDPLDVIASGPTVADFSTFEDAHLVLAKYGLWNDAPAIVKKLILDGERGFIAETPKLNDAAFKKVHTVVVGNNRTACQAALQYLKSHGLNAALLSCTLEGEANCIGAQLASIANEIQISGNPLPKPAAVVVGGETIVKVAGKGVGGRNQELVLSAALKLKHAGDYTVVVASLGTDGIDGPTDAAGAIADSATIKRAAALGLEPKYYLADNDSYHFFSKLGDLIFTGQTGTNVNDISLIIVM
jgi:glycerate-2-kinase